MTFTKWLILEKGFSSKEQYEFLLKKLPSESKRKLILYYQKEYNYYLNTRPIQLELEIK